MSDPARFNRRLSLQQPVETPDGAGGVVRSYEPVADIWAEVVPVNASAEVAADALGAFVTHRITVRAPRALTARHRFVEGARVYRILAWRENADRRLIEVAAQEQTD